MNEFKIGIKVRITKSSSFFYGVEGEIISQGIGAIWQVEICKGVGMYYLETELLILNKEIK